VSTRGQIPDTFIQEVIARTDIVDVVSRHVELKRGGANLLGLCPFHGEKSPSFTVSPTKQFYHCFGCGAHGDAIRFLMEHASMGFVDAVRELAQRAGLAVPEAPQDPVAQAKAEQLRQQHRRLEDLLRQAADHYRERLRQSPRAVAYLKARGLDGQTARRFALGYAPDGWRNLASAFPRYDDSALVESGLVIAQPADDPAESRRYDRFRDRIMFPIRTVKGEVIGFGGRVLDAGEPKYLNSPETPLFVKGRELYGLFEGHAAIRERGYALVVEGYMDVVALAQHGVGQAVATLGTACTADHVRKLLRFTDHVVFSFDGDAAGRRAAARALEASLPHVTDLRTFRFLFLPDGHDPDSFVRAQGAEAFEQQVAQAVPLSRQLIEQAGISCDLDTAEGRARLLSQARPMWHALPDGGLRRQILIELAQAARTSPDDVSRLWGVAPPRPARPTPGARSTTTAPTASRAHVRSPLDQVVRMLLLHSGLWAELSGDDHEWLTGLSGWHGEAARWLDRCVTDEGPQPWPALREMLGSVSFGGSARQLVDESEVQWVPDLEALRAGLAQARSAQARQAALRLLGRA
jgi:DNA primase